MAERLGIQHCDRLRHLLISESSGAQVQSVMIRDADVRVSMNTFDFFGSRGRLSNNGLRRRILKRCATSRLYNIFVNILMNIDFQ